MTRLNDLNDGSIKTLFILALLAANIAVASFPGSRRIATTASERNDEAGIPKLESMSK